MRNLLILAKWLAGRANVDVRLYNGETACISLEGKKRVIMIPRAWNYSQDPDAEVLLEGVIDHEALGHGRFTNLEARRVAEEAGVIKWDNLSAAVQNILEDVYIENAAIQTYPGVKANLAATVAILMKRDFFGNPKDFEVSGPSQLLVAGLLNILRGTLIPGQDAVFAENIESLNTILVARMGAMWIDVLTIAQEVENSKSTEDNIELTVRIMAVLKSAAQSSTKSEQKQAEPERDPEQDDAEDDASDAGQSAAAEPEADADTDDSKEPEAGKAIGDDSDPSDSAPAETKTEAAADDKAKADPDDSKEPAAGKAEDDAGQSDESDSSDESGDLSDESGSGDGAPSDSQVSKEPTSCPGESTNGASNAQFEEELSDDAILAARDILGTQDQETFNTELSEVIAKVMEIIASNEGAVELPDSKPHGNFSEASKQIASKVKRISDDLQDALETQTKCERRTKLTGKRINNRVLSRTRVGNARIFSTKVVEIGRASCRERV